VLCLEQISAYIATDNPTAAKKVIHGILDKAEMLSPVEAIAVDMSAAYVKAAKYVWLTSLENLTEKQQALFDNRGRSPRC